MRSCQSVCIRLVDYFAHITTHYNDHIMSTMASQITSLTVVYSIVYSRQRPNKSPKLRVTGLSEGNSPVTGEFHAQRASNAENVSIWWRHHAKFHLKWQIRVFYKPNPVQTMQTFDTSRALSLRPSWCSQSAKLIGNWLVSWYYVIPHGINSWWRHQMETFAALLALGAGNSPVTVNSPHKGQWREALMLSLICAWINSWVNNRESSDLRRHRAHYDVIVM